jgi:hypothetical protein
MEQIAVLRAQWLAQISEAIESAQHLAWQLGTREGSSAEARELYGRLEAARLEIESLRGIGLCESGRLEPDWLQKLGWNGSLSEPD